MGLNITVLCTFGRLSQMHLYKYSAALLHRFKQKGAAHHNIS